MHVLTNSALPNLQALINRRPFEPRPVLALTGLILLSGCSLLGDKESILPQGGPTMREVYDDHFKRSKASLPAVRADFPAEEAGVSDGNLEGYSREANNEIEALFPRLPNPTLVMYVFPHLSASGRAVPGYATSFQLYDKPPYALPGESGGRE